jgi:hypothetical protein
MAEQKAVPKIDEIDWSRNWGDISDQLQKERRTISQIETDKVPAFCKRGLQHAILRGEFPCQLWLGNMTDWPAIKLFAEFCRTNQFTMSEVDDSNRVTVDRALLSTGS